MLDTARPIRGIGITYSGGGNAVSIAYALMGLLTRGARHGYALRRELEEEFGADWRIDFGQLYRVLATLRRRRWISGRRTHSAQGPTQTLYTLTPRGRTEFSRWLEQPGADVVRGRDALPVKLRFLPARHTQRARALVANRRSALEAQRTTVRNRCRQAQQAQDVRALATAEARLHATEAALGALDSYAALVSFRPATARASPLPLIAVGSDDLVLDLLAQHLAATAPQIHFSTTPVGSLAGLIALHDQRAHLAGIHLLDGDSGEYNVPFVKHLLPEEPVLLLNLARREQGLMVAAGNPKEIHELRDLCRKGVRLINRQRGAGTRLLLHHRLRAARIDPARIAGYRREAPTHAAVAAAIAAGTADVGPGIRAVAEAAGLAFIPLGFERYDLAIPRTVYDAPALRPLLEVLHQTAFRQTAAAFSGYDVTDLSAIVAEVH